jgi:hypothetical protein
MRIASIAGLAMLCGLLAPAGARGADETKYFAEIPPACGLLDERLASAWLRARVDLRDDEHIPTFSSQCIYSGRGVVSREVRFVFKFMLNELFDVATLIPEQLNFNATFAANGIPPAARLDDLGRVSFAYQRDFLTMMLVVTGIRGPDDGVGRPTAFVAAYHLSDPETPHPARLDKLVGTARDHLEQWLAAAAPLASSARQRPSTSGDRISGFDTAPHATSRTLAVR